ncbi:matrixin family metalloprotease [Flavobacterium selenitireducens]|uniref:matrixin family metalloprotease n=1 Tax=Flavobacterium selenitireducens TaxID=2722704 RepID=UPI00168A92D7|nr:matrixin family metalloprotease [Flavobacterium selenitireducens]MBD3582414.1 matrixin family metalloprotease [Flavobacterium selenitireducens]
MTGIGFLIAMMACDRTQPRTICLQPFPDFSHNDTRKVQFQIQKVYKNVRILPPIDFPKNSLNAAGTRHRADSLIHFLDRRTLKHQLTIGLTNKDISTTKGKFKNWGVMGLGFCPGKSCIASTYRLDKKNRAEQLFKVAIHELGHTEGLPHCPEKSCFMRDAEGKNRKDEEKAFCPNCKRKLVALGWNLK